MADFDTWWNKAEIFCGDGGMEAAEQAWDAALQEAAKIAYKQCIDGGMSAIVALAISDAILYT